MVRICNHCNLTTTDTDGDCLACGEDPAASDT